MKKTQTKDYKISFKLWPCINEVIQNNKLVRLKNISAWMKEVHFNTVFYWAWSVREEQLLRPSSCLEHSVKFINFLDFWIYVFTLSLCLWLYLRNSKQRWQICRVSSGIVLYSADWMIVWMIILFRQFNWQIRSYVMLCGARRRLRTVQKQKRFKLR